MKYLMPLLIIFALMVVGLPLYKNHQKSAKERELIEAFEELVKVAPAINSIRNFRR